MISCSECGRHKTNDAAAERAGYRYYTDGARVLQPYCRECAEHAFGGARTQAPPLTSE